MDYLNEKAGTHRVAGGGLNDQAGRVPELDQVAAKFAEEPSHSVRTTQRATVLVARLCVCLPC